MHVQFPTQSNININMMPIVMGRPDSIPKQLHGYLPLLEHCRFVRGATVYLTVHESLVDAGATQRRPGVHTDGTSRLGWGGGSWGKSGGIYVASTDGDCRVWNLDTDEVDEHGALLSKLPDTSKRMAPGEMRCISDTTPHASIPASRAHYRQFYRLVGPEIGGWFVQHSTANPLGVMPGAPVIEWSKFQ